MTTIWNPNQNTARAHRALWPPARRPKRVAARVRPYLITETCACGRSL
jgi:hypothetical protein